MDQGRLGNVASWIVVFCAIATTMLVVRREFAEAPQAVVRKEPVSSIRDMDVTDWQDTQAAGILTGPADAPVQIVAFADFECPYCARFETTIQTIRGRYPDQVSFTFVHLPLAMHSFAETAGRVAECAHNEGRFDAIRPLLFEKHREFDLIRWTDLAEQAEIENITQFEACINDTQPVPRIERGKELANRLGIQATPTVIVNGGRLSSPPSLDKLEDYIANILDGKPINGAVVTPGTVSSLTKSLSLDD